MPVKLTWTEGDLEKLPKTIGEAIENGSKYFFTGKKCTKNHIAPRQTASGKCAVCKRESSRNRAARYREKIRSGEQNKLTYTPIKHGLTRSLEMKLYNAAKNRARKKNMDFTIKVTDIKIPPQCPILGIELDLSWGGVEQNNKNRFNKPSLDRLDPRLGYTPENVIVVSYRANMIKGDGFPNEHRQIAEFLMKYGR
ncbi:MAG TPA: hypothetical protein PKE63_02925 [Lacibacter sp.]|nr:hypothetical protein [Lacibacter sp.]HMO88526.1 hypothetical protein [Lacibacter sp.]HMP86199.1 hypothetical protein [Lacibacter sp.]